MAFAHIVIEKGHPYQSGVCIPLDECKLTVGRPTSTFKPDIAFESHLISRKHCLLERTESGWSLTDLGSKHGTVLNGAPLEAAAYRALKHGDRIELASGIAAIRVVFSQELEQTLEFDRTQPADFRERAVSGPVNIDLAKKTLFVDNRGIALSAKEWLLLELLYKDRNKFVGYERIRAAVWPERRLPDSGLVDVGVEEINVLVYRLRRKLGKHGGVIRTLRGRGCVLEL